MAKVEVTFGGIQTKDEMHSKLQKICKATTIIKRWLVII